MVFFALVALVQVDLIEFQMMLIECDEWETTREIHDDVGLECGSARAVEEDAEIPWGMMKESRSVLPHSVTAVPP